MDLTLEVTAVSGQPPPTTLRLQVREGSRLIGRNPENDLVLEDPERTVSGLHARVESVGDSFVLIDLSTNGTYLNDEPDPLPRNQPTPLQDGDALRIGPYAIAVALADAPETRDLPAPDSAPLPLPGFATQLPQPRGAASPEEPEFDPFDEPSPERSPLSEPQAADEVLPGLEQPGADADILDLLGGGGAEPTDGGILARAADPFAERPGVDDLLGAPDRWQDTAPAQTPVDQVFFQAPSTDQIPEDQIPEDYDLLRDDLRGDDLAGEETPSSAATPEPGFEFDPAAPEPTPEQMPSAAAVQSAAAEPAPTDAVSPTVADPGMPQAPPPPEPNPGHQPTAGIDPARPEPDRFEPVAEPIADTDPIAAGGFESDGTAGEAVPGAAPPLRPAPGRRAAAPQPATATSDRAQLEAFLAGLGAGDGTQVADPEAFLRSAGALLRTMVAGLSTTLMARTQFKSEMRLGVTTIRAAENNPLKFSVSVEDALERLLLSKTRGYLPAQQAVQQGFDDIQAHEMAMIAGLRSALDELLGRFAPAALEAELVDKSLDKLLPMVRKSRCWELLGERHAQISAAASEDFMRVFGDAFSRAYDEQITLLAQARRTRGT